MSKKSSWITKYIWAAYLALSLFIIGLALQLIFGVVPAGYFRFPVNIWAGILLICLISIFYLWQPHNRYILVPSSAAVAIVFSVSIGICAILMGTLVIEDSQSIWSKLGFNNITTSWYFALLFMVVLINLWWSMLRRASRLNFANLVFLINHMGLFLTLYGAFLGHGDIQRFNMSLREGEVEWQAYLQQDKDKLQMIELPFALYLKDFSMETYANKLYLVNQEGHALPANSNPKHVLLAGDSVLNLLGYQIRVLKYLPHAIPNANGEYMAHKMWGNTNAAQLSILKDGKILVDSAWLGAGNFLFPGRSIVVDENKSLIMAAPEAKKFVSKVIVYQKDSSRYPFEADITVNSPLELQGWKIYQTSYDENMGQWSTSSILELIRDPWLPVVYVGLGMLILGSFLLLFKIRKVYVE